MCIRDRPSERFAHLAETPALDQGQAVLHHLAFTPEFQQVGALHPRQEAVFAAVQGLARQVETPVEAQPERAMEHLFLLQTREHAARRGARGNVQQALLGQLQGLLQRPLLLPCSQADACLLYTSRCV